MTDEWRGITIRQPWARAVAYGRKDVENRKLGFPKNYRGGVLVHAGQGWSDRGGHDPRILHFEEWLGGREYAFGVVLAVAQLVDVHPGAGCCEPWGERTYTMNGGERVVEVAHLVLEEARLLPEPVECRGALGLWKPRPEVIEQVVAQLL